MYPEFLENTWIIRISGRRRRGETVKILVCDSQKDRAQLIKSLIEQYNYKVKIESTVEEIEKILAENNLVLIVIGPRIESMRGLELLEHIKSKEKYWDMPVIYVSDVESAHVHSELNRYRNVDFIKEPFKIKNFKHLIERWLNFRSIYV